MADIKKNNEIHDELVRINKIEEEKKTAEYRAAVQRSREDARAKAQDELENEGKFIDPHTGRETTHWNDTIEKAKSALNTEVRAYDDWRAAMLGLLNLYASLNRAIAHSLNANIYTPVARLPVDYGILPLYDKISELLKSGPEVVLPALQHQVEFTEDNKLKIAPLTRSDKGTETGLLDKLFAKGIHMWLENAGYTPDPDNQGQFVDVHGAVLTKDQFDTLKADPDQGLDHFLTNYSEVQFRPTGPG